MNRIRVQLRNIWRYGSFPAWRAKDPYRTAPRLDVEPGGFRCGPGAFVILFTVLAVISLVDVIHPT